MLVVYGRAEELAGTQEGAVIVYKPIQIFKLFGICIGKTSIKWTTKGAKVFRRGVKASKVFRSGLENGEGQDVA